MIMLWYLVSFFLGAAFPDRGHDTHTRGAPIRLPPVSSRVLVWCVPSPLYYILRPCTAQRIPLNSAGIYKVKQGGEVKREPEGEKETPQSPNPPPFPPLPRHQLVRPPLCPSVGHR